MCQTTRNGRKAVRARSHCYGNGINFTILVSSNVDIMNQYYCTKWRCSHSNDSFTLRRQWQINNFCFPSPSQCEQDHLLTWYSFFCCHWHYNWVQNPFHDDTKIMKLMSVSPQCEGAVTVFEDPKTTIAVTVWTRFKGPFTLRGCGNGATINWIPTPFCATVAMAK